MMKVLVTAAICGGLTLGMVGCAEEAGVKSTTTTTTPSGSTTVTQEKKVEATGDAPPPATTPTDVPK